MEPVAVSVPGTTVVLSLSLFRTLRYHVRSPFAQNISFFLMLSENDFVILNIASRSVDTERFGPREQHGCTEIVVQWKSCECRVPCERRNDSLKKNFGFSLLHRKLQVR